MDVCLRTSLPFIFIALTFLAVSLSKAAQGTLTRSWLSMLTGTSQDSIDFNVNDLMLGTQDPFLWFLVPLFGVISAGVCIAGNYLITILMHIMAFALGWVRGLWRRQEDARYVAQFITSSHRNKHNADIDPSRTTNSFTSTGANQRLLTTGILLLLITTLIPYQFAYMVLTSSNSAPAFAPSASPATPAPAPTTTSTTTRTRCSSSCSGFCRSTCLYS